jgi:hypothetical protein
MRHALQEYVFEFDLKLALFVLLKLRYVDKEHNVHASVHELDFTRHAVKHLVLDLD